MADFLTPEERSHRMSLVRGKNTQIERVVSRGLRRAGLSFTQNSSRLPGRPDIAFHRIRVAVFLDGDFWHGKDFAVWSQKLLPFWRAKIERNIARDKEKDRALRALGWKVIHVWES